MHSISVSDQGWYMFLNLHSKLFSFLQLEWLKNLISCWHRKRHQHQWWHNSLRTDKRRALCGVEKCIESSLKTWINLNQEIHGSHARSYLRSVENLRRWKLVKRRDMLMIFLSEWNVVINIHILWIIPPKRLIRNYNKTVK